SVSEAVGVVEKVAVSVKVGPRVEVDVKNGVSLGVRVGRTVGVTCGIDILHAASRSASSTNAPRTISTSGFHYKPPAMQRDLRLPYACPSERGMGLEDLITEPQRTQRGRFD